MHFGLEGRCLFQCRYLKMQRLLEGGAYLRPGAYQRKYDNICIIYLHVIGLFKSCYCYVLFLPFKKFSKYYEKYSWFQNSVLTNIRNKCVIRKINLYFFDVMRNEQIFPSNVFHFQFDYRFLFSREMGNIRTCKEIRLEKRIKFGLSGQYSF